ncbi:TIGR01777 family oxidoreductase [Taibaiella koreensis]|uniref:TIGR01777 family oxidoreductase n=1 Tax=Taibaiella koreensis TaxID=1268548 RepID=UPI000E59F0BF|nr:TIGR01777 family oxidoreductase [Taibaiella koreensis]
MSKEKIILAGGTGFIGRYLAARFHAEGKAVQIISRNEGIAWKDTAGITHALEGAAMLINLAGRSVDCRYTPVNKEIILKSRTETTQILGEAIGKCSQPPGLWLNSSTATIYRHAEDRPMTEAEGEIGNGFSVSVAKAWEEAFFAFECPHTRQVALRIAIVLGAGGGVMGPYRNMVRWGMGGRQGSGRQRFSWIHIEDLYRAINFVAREKALSGPVNCAAPFPVTNSELMTLLRRQLHMPFGIPVPVWLLKTGARLIHTETELVLKSRWVLPERLLAQGFGFLYPHLDAALAQIINGQPTAPLPEIS